MRMPVEQARPGDKVRVKGNERSGERGVVRGMTGSDLLVELDSGDVIVIEPRAVTNYSAAARKAWQTMPTRGVGRPPTGRSPQRRTVSIRVDTDLWKRFGEAVEVGLIQSREHAINAWISIFVAKYLDGESDDVDGRIGGPTRPPG